MKCEFNTYCIKKEVDVLQIKLGIFWVEVWRFYNLFKIVHIIGWFETANINPQVWVCVVYLSLPNNMLKRYVETENDMPVLAEVRNEGFDF